jgi:hypothetical protein
MQPMRMCLLTGKIGLQLPATQCLRSDFHDVQSQVRWTYICLCWEDTWVSRSQAKREISVERLQNQCRPALTQSFLRANDGGANVRPIPVVNCFGRSPNPAAVTCKYTKSWSRRIRSPVKRMHIASLVQVTYARNEP